MDNLYNTFLSPHQSWRASKRPVKKRVKRDATCCGTDTGGGRTLSSGNPTACVCHCLISLFLSNLYSLSFTQPIALDPIQKVGSAEIVLFSVEHFQESWAHAKHHTIAKLISNRFHGAVSFSHVSSYTKMKSLLVL